LEANISQVVDENCDGCAYCIEPCPYQAIALIEYMRNGSVKKTEKAQDVMEEYQKDNFKVEFIEEAKQNLVYTRRVVTKIVLEGEAPPA